MNFKAVADLFREFINAEVEMYAGMGVGDLDNYNKKMLMYCDKFIARFLNKKWWYDLEEFYTFSEKTWKKEKPIKKLPRKLFKISEYKNELWKNIWVCYVSSPSLNFKGTKIQNAFIISEVDKNLKIICQFTPEDDDFRRWRNVGGDRRLVFENLGELVAIERIERPYKEKLGEDHPRNIRNDKEYWRER